MIRWALVVFLFAHGWVHLVVWGVIPSMAPEGMKPAHSWILGDNRGVADLMSLVAAALFAVAALGLAVGAGWWGPVAVAGGAASMLLVALFPAALLSAWVLVPGAINAALIVGITWLQWPATQSLGG